jgi:class 3 adenylate cyclase
MEPQIQYCTTSDGVSIAYYTLGDGPPLIWLHGTPSHLQLEWKIAGDLYENLAREHTIVRFDWRGSGLSQRGITPTSDGVAIDIEAILQQLGGGNLSLVALGGSSLPALIFAAGHADRLRRLVLWEGFANRADLGSQMDALEGLARSDYNMFVETLARAITGWNNHEEALTYASMLRAAMTPEEWLAFFTQPFGSVEHLLPRITCPTLVVHNRGAALVPMEAIQRLVAGIRGARLAMLDGSSVADSVTSTPIVRDFLRSDDATSDLPGPAATATPSSLRTVLFTDLVGHTEMMSRLGDERGRDVLREHERITREVLKANGGTEVKTMGDGFMASFGSVTKAVECAVALQRAFADREGEPLSVRVGLNAGEPIEEDGDLFGATVILASRIAAKAGGGEILVADTVRGLCSGKGFLFADRGEFVAKGIEEPVRVYEVRWRE